MSSSSSQSDAPLRRRLLELMAAGDTESVLELVERLEAERTELKAKHSEVENERDGLARTLDKKEIEIRRLRRLLHGRRSERLSVEELAQLVLAYGATPQEASQPDPKLPLPKPDDTEPDEERPKPKKRRPNHRGRTRLSPDLERNVTEVPVPDDERACKCCGKEMETFDYVEHERVRHIPGRFVVDVERREKVACRACKGDAVTADRVGEPEEVRVDASVLALLVESKCDDALPIHRQCDQFARMGFELPESTGYRYWRYVTDLLLPISDALLGTVLEDPDYICVDDTGLDVLDRTRKDGKYRGHLWCFRAASGLLAYRFTETWKAEEVAPWFQLIGESTFVQVDDYKGYSATITTPDGQEIQVVPPDRRLGCMMHVRRRFYEALRLGDRRAAKAVKWIQDIYKIEKRARGRPPDERLAIREAESLPILDEFDAWVDEQLPKMGKTGKLAKAVRYARQQREFVRRCFSDGRFEIDNGAVERAIREPALGRKNFLFTGSTAAAQRLAAAYTLVQTCRALGISTREYLIDVITKLQQGWPARRLTELLPHRWAELRPE